MSGWQGGSSRPGPLRTTGRRETVRQVRGRLCGDQGQSLYEFAWIIGILFMLLLGIIGLGLAGYTYHYVSEAAREGTRYAIVRGASCAGMPDCNASANQISTYVKGLGYGGINPTNMTVTTTWWSPSVIAPSPVWSICGAGTCNAPGNMVEVNVTYAYPLDIPFWGNKTINLSSTSQMVISQ
jgi:Flp pilus assembly protein TadG